MASINIYVTEDFKERMTRVETNWSEVCRRAIEAELSRLETTDHQPTAELPPNAENWKQITFTEDLLEQGVVIKPSMAPNYSGTPVKEVAVLSSWLADINKAIGNTGVGGARISQLLEGSYPVQLLMPGKSWISGRLKLIQQLAFSYPSSEESVEE
jgi:post-segregation antitoxin (ccd killing protein)